MNMNWKHLLHDFVEDESGQDMIEYALVAALVALGAVVGLKGLGTGIQDAFTAVTTTLAKP